MLEILKLYCEILPSTSSPVSPLNMITTQALNAPSSTFNVIGGSQFNHCSVSIVDTSAQPANSSSKQPAQLPFIDAPIHFLSDRFTGRNDELAVIERALHRSGRNVPMRCVLYGNQGVGKSQLTYKWAKSTYDRGENRYVVWISATTVEKLYQGFCRLLHSVKHPDRSHPEQSVRLAAAQRWLEEVDSGDWLLVLDNVFPETVDFLREHLPRQNGRGSILLTTRTQPVAMALASAAGERHEVVEVPLLSVAAGVELFLGHFSGGEIDALSAKVEQIVKSVGCLPLAISHAASYMKQSGSTVGDMVNLYESKRKIDVSVGAKLSLESFD